MNEKRCVICGFKDGLASHHIIKRKDWGSDNEDNLVLLCPNHHWLADFGDDQQRKGILNKIKEYSGKQGEYISSRQIEHIDMKIRALEEDRLYNGKEMNNIEWQSHKQSWSYDHLKKILLGRSSLNTETMHKKAHLLILRKIIDKELEKCQKNR